MCRSYNKLFVVSICSIRILNVLKFIEESKNEKRFNLDKECIDGCPCPLFDCETGQLISSTTAETTTTQTTTEETTMIPSTTVETTTTMNTSDPPFDTTRETTVPETDPETTTEQTTTSRPTTTTQWKPVMGNDIFVLNSNTKNKHIQFSWAQDLEDPEFDELEAFKWPRDTKVENSCSMKFRGVMYILGGSGTVKVFFDFSELSLS